MHELSLAQALVEQVNDVLRREGAERALRVTVRIGALSGVDPDAFAFAFPMAAEDTPCEGAGLELVAAPARARCRACGHGWEATGVFPACPSCGHAEADLEGGREFLLSSLEIDGP